MLVGAEAEVLHGLTRVLRATEQDDIRASGRTKSELIESQALASGLLDAGAGGGSEAQRADAQLWYLIEAIVIRHSAYNGADLALVCLCRMFVCGNSDDFAQANGRAVDLAYFPSD